jgi:GNAT superfamily N-acetyltransferase
MRIIEVTDQKTRRDFLNTARILYNKDPFWVCPLDSFIEDTFNPLKNKYFSKGNAHRWILKDGNDNLIGRIAAFYYKPYSDKNKQPTGGIGWFECINDQNAANLLFDTAKEWLLKEGLHAMDGPINFGENDNYWGLLVEGFIHPGMGMPYNHSYYRNLFETYGFGTYYEQFCYHIDVTIDFPERFWKIAEWVLKKPDFRFVNVDLSKIEQFIHDLIKIVNEAWPSFKEDYIQLQPEVVRREFINLKPILEEELIWFIYHKDEPVGFFLFFPDHNMILKHLNGKLHLINKLRFYYYKKIRYIKRVRAVAAGIVPRFQGIGLESAVFMKLQEVFRKRPWLTEIEISWVSDTNPKMRSVYEAVGSKLAKKYITYRYLFDRNAEFVRFMPHVIEKIKNDKTKNFQNHVFPDSGAIYKKYNYLKYKKN